MATPNRFFKIRRAMVLLLTGVQHLDILIINRYIGIYILDKV